MRGKNAVSGFLGTAKSVFTISTVTARPGLARTTGLFYVVGGVVVSFIAAWNSDEGRSLSVVAAVALVGVLIGLATMTVGRNLARDAFHVMIATGTGLITAAVVAIDDVQIANSLMGLYILVLVDVAFFFTPVAVGLHTALVFACASIAIRSHDMTWVFAAPFGVVCLTLVGVVAWLARMSHAGDEDPLTLLPNRRSFDDRLEDAFEDTEREHYQLSLILLGLDLFKKVNTERGTAAADQLLRDTADHWRRHLGLHQYLARHGGDVFAVILPGVALGRAASLADELRDRLPQGITASAGVATWVPGDTPSMLVSRADVALFDAKSAGRDQTVVYGDPERGASVLESAIAQGQMELYVQPIIRLSDREPVSAESLVRWNHPAKGVVGPGEFVQQAERTGAIHSLGAWTLDEACRMLSQEAPRLPAPALSVNVSVPELRSPQYAVQVRRVLERWDVNPAQLTIEVTEAVFDGDDPQVIASLEQIHALGVRIALDDFGSGYSSLRWIEMLPFDTMKIDAAFVWSIPEGAVGPEELPVLAAIITMGRALGKRVVAEGVETEHQARLLRELGCEFAQGYLFGRPTPLG